ncbi:hypothetical protein ES703_28418 [subsurface metagenome]
MRVKTTPSGSYLPLTGGTLTGDLNIGAHLLKTTSLALKQVTGDSWGIRDVADTGYRDLYTRKIVVDGGLALNADGCSLDARDVDATYAKLQARDTSAALAEIARLQGAADPYFQATLPMVLKPGSAPGTPVEGHFYYDDTTKLLRFRDASLWRDVHSAGGPMVMHASKLDLTYESASPVTLKVLPAGSILLYVAVNVTTLFNGTTPLLEIGYAGHTAEYLDQYAPTSVAWTGDETELGDGLQDATLKYRPRLMKAARTIIVTHTHAGATQGVAECYAVYIKLT